MTTPLDPWRDIPEPRDRIVLSAAPILPMPPSGHLQPVDCGRRRYIAALDGVYVQSRNRVLDVTLRMADTPRLPFGVLAEQIQVPHQLIPRALFEKMQRKALDAHPQEWAGLVHWHPSENRYVLTEPKVTERSPVKITYETTELDHEWLILNIHSHGHGVAQFSMQDDQSDQHGVYFASVFGLCGSPETITVTTRLVIDGYFYPLDWHPWED